MNITETVERLRLLPGACIDTGFRQGRGAVLRQLNQRYEEDRIATVDKSIARMQAAIKAVINRAAPYAIPDDYIAFLEHYGGFMIDGPNYNLSLLGVGPMAEEWYGFVNTEDWALMESGKLGWLSIGSLVFRKGHKYNYQRVLFFLDLADIISKHSVIGIGPWDGANPEESIILTDIPSYPGKWRLVAHSFTEWLNQAAETQGLFVYS